MKTFARSLIALLFATQAFAIAGCGAFGQGCDNTLPSDKFGSCPDSYTAKGQIGGECNDLAIGSQPCDAEGAACYRDKCWACGGQGELCCNGDCDVGTCAVVDPSSDDPKTCTSNCGLDGQPPCPDGSCKNDKVHGVCSPTNESNGCSGSNSYATQFEDNLGCLHPAGPFFRAANSKQDIQACLPAPPGYSFYGIYEMTEDYTPDPYKFRPDCSVVLGPGFDDTLTITHFSSAEATACMQQLKCAADPSNCGWEICSN